MLREDIEHLLIDFPLEFDNEVARQAAQDAGARVLRWVLAPIGGKRGIATRVMAARILLGWEEKSVTEIARKLRVTKQALSKACVALAPALNLPQLRSAAARDSYSRGQKRAGGDGRHPDQASARFLWHTDGRFHRR
jgi:hypothetical protein